VDARNMSLRKDAFWTGLDIFISSGLAFLFRLVMAKLLAPDQFGIVAMVLAVYSILQTLGDFGLTASLVQRHESQLDDSIVPSTFAISVVVSLALFAIALFFAAPLSAVFFSTGEVGAMIAALSACFLLTPFSSVSTALLYRRRAFRELTTIRGISTLVGLAGAAVFLLVYGTAWTIVVQILLTQLFMTVGLYARAGWRPSLRWQTGAFRSIVSYSGLVFLNDVAVAMAKNLDVAVIGRILTKADVGIYSLAFFLTDIVRLNLMSILNRVMFVRYAQDQNDTVALRRNYLETMRWNCLIIFPLMTALILFGPELVLRLYGPSWASIEPVLQLLALSVIFHAAGGTSSTLYKAIGKPGLDLAMFLGTTATFLVPGVIGGALLAGMVGVAAGVAIAKLLTVITRQIVLDRLIGSTLRRVFQNFGTVSLMQAPIVAVWVIGRWLGLGPSLTSEILLPTLGLAIYGGLLALHLKPWRLLRLQH
jgi:teichuronic acid exporter